MPENISKELFLTSRMRVFVILHLCLAFTSFVYYAGYPFLRELFEIRSDLVLYQYVMDKSDPVSAECFSLLPTKDQELITKNRQWLSERMARPTLKKWADALHILLFGIPVFERAWLFFSIVLCILLLFRFEGAWLAVWILPLIVVAYGYDAAQRSPEKSFFPSEEYIRHHYLEGPLSETLSLQKEQLLNAWRRYLIVEWADEVPSEDPEAFLSQAKKGQFFFTAAGLLREDLSNRKSAFSPPPPTFSPLIFLYFFWNGYFAWQFSGPWRRKRTNVQLAGGY